MISTKDKSYVLKQIPLQKLIEEISDKRLIFLKESHEDHQDMHNSKIIIDSLYRLDPKILIGLEYSKDSLFNEKDICRNHQELLALYGGNVMAIMSQDLRTEDDFSDLDEKSIIKEGDIANILTDLLIRNKRIITLLGKDHLKYGKGVPFRMPGKETQAIIYQGKGLIMPINEGIYSLNPQDSDEKRSFYEIIGKIKQ